LLAVGAWAALLVLRRERFRRALLLAVGCGAALVAVHGVVAATTGFDPIGTIRATEAVYRSGVASMRPYWYWVLGSPVGFLLVLGIPITWFALRGLVAGSPEAIAIFGVLAFAAVAGFTKAETERIWLFFAPYVCLAAAPVLAGRRSGLGLVLAALAAQALVHELLFDTVW
jgi:methylthioxylose transferase